MNDRLVILAMGVLAANAVFLAPATAQTEGKFYCGQSYDPLNKTNIPATLMSSPRRAKPITVILWKSEYFSKGFIPQQSCAIVSPKFQAAYTSGKLEYLKVGNDRKLPIVCAVRTADEPCDKASMLLFTLKPYGDSDNALKTLMGNIEGGEADLGSGIYQSSKVKSEVVVNMRDFLKSRQ